TGQQQAAPGPVVDRERENAAQRPHQIRALLLVQVDEDLGVGAALEDVSAAGQGGAQVGVVVDLAVVDDLDAAVLVGHRLRPARQALDTRRATPLRTGMVPATPVLVISSSTRLCASRLMYPGSWSRRSSSY